MKKNPAYHNARFVLGAAELDHLPADEGYEVAFAGRSNAGKSSAINAITGIKSLARTSKTPGRTQHINVFSLDEQRRFIDLPGYGYAKVPQKVRQKWGYIIADYLHSRQSLHGVIVMMDIRHTFTDLDNQLLEWCLEAEMPVHILLTKSDKLSKGAALSVLQKARNILNKNFSHGDYPIFSASLFSAFKKTGIEDIHEKLDEWLNFG